MSLVGKPERETQNRIIALFRDELRYRYLGDWTDREGNSNIEEELLSAYLKRNGYTSEQINAAIYTLRKEADNSNRGLYSNNKAVYTLLRYGVPVKTEAGAVTETVHLIDWNEPEKNDFFIAEEVTLEGNHERRPDLVLYVNGIAVSVIELKNSRISIGEGIRQLISNQRPEFNEWFFSTMQIVFAILKLNWIRKQQHRIRAQERETKREYVERESHYVWGKRYLLHVVEGTHGASIELLQNKLVLTIRSESNPELRRSAVEAWYRDQIRDAIEPLLIQWESMLRVRSNRVIVRRMKTKWGSCNHRSKNIHLNTELAKKPPVCLEYVLVHELIHLLEPTHNARFIALMDHHIPQWRHLRDELNRAPLGHVEWEY